MARKASANFDAALKRFHKSARTHREDARECAEYAIKHFAEHGDLIYADRFVEALHETRTLKARSFVGWMIKHAPVEFKGKFKGDAKRGKPSETDLESALAEAFWDVNPDPKVQEMSYDDLFKTLDRTVARFEDETKVHLSDKGQAALQLVKTALAQVRNQPIQVNDNSTQDTSAVAEVAA